MREPASLSLGPEARSEHGEHLVVALERPGPSDFIFDRTHLQDAIADPVQTMRSGAMEAEEYPDTM